MSATLPKLRVDLLGKLRLSVGTLATTRFETRRTALLLARLALPPLREWPREELIELLWPDEDPGVTRTRFRQTLASLRRALLEVGTAEEAVLRSSRSSVGLEVEQVVCDVIELESCLKRASVNPELRREALDRALELYEHHLLPGFYETWVLSERDRLENGLRSALIQLSQSLTETDSEAAITYARGAVALDPLSETAQEQLLKLLVQLGRPADAARHWKELERLFWKELRTQPPDSLQAALHVTPARSTPSSSSSSAEPVIVAPLLGVVPLPRTLPNSLDSFVGRVAEQERLWTLLAEGGTSRLVTLTGPPGVGKTRLALEVGHRLESESGEGNVIFVALEQITTGELALAAIHEAAGGQREKGALLPALTQLLRVHRQPLLVLDNAEGVGGLGEPLQSLLQGVPELRCLVTSQRPLQISGEHELVLEPLELGSEDAALALLLDRARQVRPDLALTPQNQTELLQLCRELDGLPLALELAAAWLGMLSPEQIRSRLKRDQRLLARRATEAGVRHSSLYVALEESLARLTPNQREILMRLAVFRGGWTLEAAEHVCEDLSPLVLLDLEALRMASLISAFTQPDGEHRFKMLETVRHYAQQCQTPEGFQAAQKSHLGYFCTYAEQLANLFESPEQHRYFEGVTQEQENLQAAFEYAHKSDSTLGARLGVAFSRYWDRRGQHDAGIALMESFVGTLPPQEILLKARANEVLGRMLTVRFRHYDALNYYRQSQQCYQQAGEFASAALAQCHAAAAQRNINPHTDISATMKECLEGYAFLESQGSLPQKAAAAIHCGVFYTTQRNLPKAREVLERSLALNRIIGNQRNIGSSLFILGHAERNCGNLRGSVPLEEEALSLARRIGDDFFGVVILWNLYEILLELEDYPAAEQYIQEGLLTTQQLGMGASQTLFLMGQGRLHFLRNEPAQGRHWFRQGLKQADAMGAPIQLLHSALWLVRLALQEAQKTLTLLRQREAAHLYGVYLRLEELLQPQQRYDYEEPLDESLKQLEEALGTELFQAERDRALKYELAEAVLIPQLYPESEEA